MRRVEADLQNNPYVGDVVPGTGGVRKMRAAMEGRGKRGGARVLYYFVARNFKVYFLLVYAKSVTRDISPETRKLLHSMAKELDEKG